MPEDITEEVDNVGPGRPRIAKGPVKSIIFNRDKLTRPDTRMLPYADEGGHKTACGTPIKVLQLVDSGRGWLDAQIATAKGYKNFIKIEDIFPPLVIPEELTPETPAAVAQ